MFNAKDKITGEIVKIYAVDGGDFLIACQVGKRRGLLPGG